MGTEGGGGNIKQSVEHTMLQSHGIKKSSLFLRSTDKFSSWSSEENYGGKRKDLQIVRQHLLLSWREQEDGAAATSCLPCPLLWHQKELWLSVALGGAKLRCPTAKARQFWEHWWSATQDTWRIFLPKPNLDGAVSTTGYQNKTEWTWKENLWAKTVVKDQRNESKFRSLRGEAVISEQELSNSDTFGKQWKRCTYKNRHQNTNPMWDNSASDQGVRTQTNTE